MQQRGTEITLRPMTLGELAADSETEPEKQGTGRCGPTSNEYSDGNRSRVREKPMPPIDQTDVPYLGRASSCAR
ncbi:hypothetical protein Pla52n_03500 [Stieleria varia]|uniref:Uncharacterized protein n=1 Tax=Stieleria varia TaxID=2528005 RepID=A0A5C6B933_9BACT|nr:hypothetical protein Pla52n_03500 [Stieleria varia]